MQKTNQEEFRIVKVFKRKGNKLLNRKAMITHLIDGLIKKTLYKMSQYFPKLYQPFGRDINIKVDFSNYAKEAHLKKLHELMI